MTHFYIRQKCNPLTIIKTYWRALMAIIIPLALLPLILVPQTRAANCAYVLILMTLYWVMEILPMAITSMLPIALFPLLGIMSTPEVTVLYMKDTIMMFITSIMFAIAMEHSQLHRRIALRVLLFTGSSFGWIITGFMIATTFLSMWITNAAAVAIMLPIALEIVKEISYNPDANSKNFEMEETKINDEKEYEKKKLVLLLCIAYSANCGGLGTLTGTAPNLIFHGYVEDVYSGDTELTYGSWLIFNVPCVILCVLVIRIMMQFMYLGFRRSKKQTNNIGHIIRFQYEQLGSITFHEIAVSVLFIIVVLLWLTRDLKSWGGWQTIFGGKTKIGDSTAATLMSVFLFIIPAKPSENEPSKTLLDWKTAQAKLPWWLFFLVGGGFALAEGSKVSGLSDWISIQLNHLVILPPWAIVFIICFLTAFLTEVVSNPTAANLLLPVVDTLSRAVNVHPFLLMIPTTAACSFSFMLPIATGPNAMTYAAGNMSYWDMVKPGFFIKIICCLIEIGMIYSLGSAIFNVHTLPPWALNVTVTH